MKTLSLYSGAGGIDLGFKKNKFHTLLAIENWDKACETLKINKIASKIICDDIRNIDFKDLQKQYKFDFVVGGPPCPPFSKSRLAMALALRNSNPLSRATAFLKLMPCNTM